MRHDERWKCYFMTGPKRRHGTNRRVAAPLIYRGGLCRFPRIDGGGADALEIPRIPGNYG